ncbi:MAG TPA: hypothetical protein EYO59_12375 [Chromatiaceae bacterium]|nr:hypothetical protein [Chromatiaceae bacterium]
MLFYLTLIINGAIASTAQLTSEDHLFEAIEGFENGGWTWISSEPSGNGGSTVTMELIVGDDKYQWTRDGVN